MSQYINPRAKVLYHVDRLHELRATGNTSAPVNVEIDLSNRCSHGCQWCHFAYTHTRGPLAGKQDKPENYTEGGDLMSSMLAYNILDDLSDCGVRSVTWTGGGEPTLHPQFDSIVDYADTIGMQQGLYTHGSHIGDERAQLLKETMTFVYVSLDECTTLAFQRSKGVDRFEKVLYGIEALVKAEGDATIGVGFLLHRGNVDDVCHMEALGRKLGVDYVQFRPIIAYDQSAPNQLVEDTAWVDRAINNLRQFAGDPFVQADTKRFEMYRDWRTHGYKTCNWSAMQTVITPNGKVWRCTNKREHADAMLGDLTQESFRDLWRRAGGACQVDDTCRLMCRGHISNLTLDAIIAEPEHVNFI